MSKETFTVQKGMEVQLQQLKFWQGLLKEEIYDQLFKAVHLATIDKRLHGKLRSGYDVPRGVDIDSWIMNIHNDYNPLNS